MLKCNVLLMKLKKLHVFFIYWVRSTANYYIMQFTTIMVITIYESVVNLLHGDEFCVNVTYIIKSVSFALYIFSLVV